MSRKKNMTLFEKILKASASLKLAVFVIVALGVISAVGTIIESKYDAEVAQKLVYHSKWMYGVMLLLCYNLIAVMVDRWPWKRHHTGFVLAHIGIIISLIGAYVTQHFGIDGSMAFELGQSQKFVTIPKKQLNVYAFLPETNSYKGLLDRPRDVDFFLNPPTEEDPYQLRFGANQFEIVDYYHYAVRESRVVRSDKDAAGPAIRYKIESSRANATEWLFVPRQSDSSESKFGPLTVRLARKDEAKYRGKNEVYFYAIDSERFGYKIFAEKAVGLVKTGVAKVGDVIQTGFMDIAIRFINYYDKSEEKVSYVEKQSPSNLTRNALRVKFNDELYWLGENSVLRVFSDQALYILSYGNLRLDLRKVTGDPNFDIKLEEFRVGRYQGTMRAASYESDVSVPGAGRHTISMNNPLKYRGLTFYQASFQEDDMGRPMASILSVNKDPGRGLKYLGSLLIVLGAIIMFYFKRLKFKSAQKGASK